MTFPPTTTEMLDPLSDLDGEDLACLGLRRADDGPFGELLRELRKQGHEEYLANLPKPPKPSKARKPSIRTLLAQAKAAGVTAVTLPDGTKLDFGKPEPGALENPWLADLDKVKQQ